ncbi:ribokinase [Thermosipho sp. (in: thermotogales)]|jgi:ribokinase|uniref:ribokinase n=1 Tax=Thermosipho sp. (in: thermotogales) TaxID=1968895 RepID=UPI00257D71D3|nr:ribokinase [Thermosipho sp. (in: thermotogales)]MBZ4650614.1 rbsK [Thermosipho sp. (in: thermotogales)]
MIAVVGSSNMDVVLTVERFTLPGETQRAQKLEFFPGGKGSNQAVSIAKLSKKNSNVYFLTCIGNDSYGRDLKDQYDKLNIKGYVVVDDNNGLAFIEVTKKGENRIVIYPGANRNLTKEIIKKHEEKLLEADYILLQNEIPFESTLYSARIFSENGKIVIFDPAPVSGIEKEIFQFVDFLTPNEEEIKLLTEKFFGEFVSYEDSYFKLKSLGVKKLIVKLGSKGVIYFEGDKRIEIPSFKVKAVDTTAAGDVFNGAFVVALHENLDIRKSLEFASAAAALSVTKKGAQNSIPSRKEVENFLNI